MEWLLAIAGFFRWLHWNSWRNYRGHGHGVANAAWYLGGAAWDLFRPIFSWTFQWSQWAIPIWRRIWKDYARPALVMALNLLRLADDQLRLGVRPILAGVRSMAQFGQLALANISNTLLVLMLFLRSKLPAAAVPFRLVGEKVDSELFGIRSLLTSPFTVLRQKANVTAAWVNHAFVASGMIGQGVFTTTALFALRRLVNLVANVGRPVDPAPAIAQLLQQNPRRTVPELVTEWSQGQTTERPAVVAAAALFRQLVQ